MALTLEEERLINQKHISKNYRKPLLLDDKRPVVNNLLMHDDTPHVLIRANRRRR
jgi:hypothetical protein